MDMHEPVDKNKTYEEMTREEKLRYDHMKMHEKHKGHEAMHLEMMLVLFVTLVVAQLILVQWKKRYYKSYLFTSLIALWLVPVSISAYNAYYRFVIIWVIFSLITAIVMRKASMKPISGYTPRLVYKWFNFIYKLTYVLGIIGYCIVLGAFFGINLIFGQEPPVWMDPAMLIIFYGLYYGVLGRDLSEICSERMAANIGYYHPKGMPTRHLEENMCAVCGNTIIIPPPPGESEMEALIEASYKLPCGHVFHEFCIRGWCIVGKKQTCPYCCEKVDLKRLFKSPWEKPHVLYGQLLDWLRYMVAWQPLILCIVQSFNMVLGLDGLEGPLSALQNTLNKTEITIGMNGTTIELNTQ